MSRERVPAVPQSAQNAAFLAVATAIALAMRLFLFPLESGDYQQFLHPWFETLRQNGGLAAVGLEIGDYTPPYFYVLALLTYLPVRDLFSIKAVSCAADVVLAVFAANLASGDRRLSQTWTAAYCAVLFLPSVFLNSAAWGQCDAMYVSALLAFVYYAWKGRDVAAAVSFGVSITLKLQAVFLAPLFLLLLLKKRLRWRSVLAVPAVYVAACLPAAAMGRNLWDLLTIYFRQAGQYNLLAMYLPNLYTWLGDSADPSIGRAGIFLAGGVVLCAVFFLWQQDLPFTLSNLLVLAFFFALLTPFLLPYMHERYYYAADLLGVCFAFHFPKKWWMPFAVCLSSAYVVCHNLFQTDFLPVQLLGVLILFVLVQLVRFLAGQLRKEGEAA